jgi:hypothetical protein
MNQQTGRSCAGKDPRPVNEGLPFGYRAGCIDDGMVILENACQSGYGRSCQISLMHDDALSKFRR